MADDDREPRPWPEGEEHAMSSNSSKLGEQDWQYLVNRHVATVWRVIEEACLPFRAAVEVNRLTWMRLADHIHELPPERIELWLRQTTLRELARSARLLEMGSSLDEIAD